MPRAGIVVRQADIKRAVSAVEAAGLKVARVEIDTVAGRIICSTAEAAPKPPGSALDKWLEGKNGSA